MADFSSSSTLSRFGFAFGLLSAAASTVALVIVNSGRPDPENVGYLRQFIAGAMGGPVTWVAVLAMAIGLFTYVSHSRHGLSKALPLATQALSAYSIVVCATLPS